MLFLAAFIPFWFVEIQSPNFPPFKIAGGYSSEAACKEELPDIKSEWSAKTYTKGHAKAGQNAFGNVEAECKLQEAPKP